MKWPWRKRVEISSGRRPTDSEQRALNQLAAAGMRVRVYKHGIQWRVDVPQSPFPLQLFDWQHAMDIANEYAWMAQFAERAAEYGPGWRELLGNQP